MRQRKRRYLDECKLYGGIKPKIVARFGKAWSVPVQSPLSDSWGMGRMLKDSKVPPGESTWRSYFPDATDAKQRPGKQFQIITLNSLFLT